MDGEPEAGGLARRWLDDGLTRRQVLGRLVALGLSMPSAAALLAACSRGSNGSSRSSARSKLTVGIVQEPTSLDPTVDPTASISLLLRDNVYEGLVRLDDELMIQPGLARSWDVSPDGHTFTFHLHPGVKFHDGSDLVAENVDYSWDRAMDTSGPVVNPHVDYWAPVQSVEPVDDLTLRVTLNRYSDSWLFHMASGAAAIVSASTAGTNTTRPVGTGPFKFVSWDRGSALNLTRNDAYWGPRARLRDVAFTFTSDPSAMTSALRAGRIDASGQVGAPEQAAGFRSDSRFRVLEGQPVGKIIVAMNNARGALSDPRVRRAISMAIDRRAWIQGVLAGYGVPIGSHSSPNAGEPYYADQTAVNPHDPQAARQLLQAAGLGPGLSLRLAQVSNLPYAVRATDLLIGELRAVGIAVTVERMGFSRWLAQVFSPSGPQDYDLTIIDHAEERDIGNYANPRYYWHYSNPQVGQWLTQADAEPDPLKRQAIYSRVQRQLAVDAANGFVMSGKTLAVTDSRLRGYPVASLASPLYLRDTYFT